MQSQTAELTKTLGNLRKHMSEHGEEYEQLKEENKKYSKEVETLKNNLIQIAHEKEKLIIEKNSFLREKQILETWIKEFQAMKTQKMQQIVSNSEKERKESIGNLESKHANRAETLKKELSITQSKLNTLNCDYTKLESLKQRLEFEKNKLETNNDELTKSNQMFQDEIQRLKSRISQLESDKKRLLNDNDMLEMKFTRMNNEWQEQYETLEIQCEEMQHVVRRKTSEYDNLWQRYTDKTEKEKVVVNLEKHKIWK